ncbi:hypothetical protein DJ521_07415, partial [Sulfolobus sp. E3]
YYYLISNVSYSINYTVGYTPQVQKGYIKLDNNSTIRVLFTPQLFRPILNISFLSNGSVVKRLIQGSTYTLRIIAKNLGNASENVKLTISMTVDGKYIVNGTEYNFTLSQNGSKLMELPIKFNISGNMTLSVSLYGVNEKGEIAYAYVYMRETVYTQGNYQKNSSTTQTNTQKNINTSSVTSQSRSLTTQTKSSTLGSKSLPYNIVFISIVALVTISAIIILLSKRK